MKGKSFIFGYARVSTKDQDLSVQLEKLNEHGVDRIYSEKLSGKNTNRPELEKMIEQLRDGDTVVITKIDRLARNMRDFQNIVHELTESGVTLKILDQNIDTSSAQDKLFMDMLAMFADFERTMILERQREGIAHAKEKGVYKGRKPTSDDKKQLVLELAASGMKKADIQRETGLGKTTVFKIIKESNI
ncbi:recombinase family protein [Pseudoalteromonas sp. SWYJZ98]|uniref:recombinase family protein n=1 Tax=Pseudoalteromonas sp. SWYJZ98 TaxID=2792060 RepID=UPI0018CCB92E|nr:recombinase family protein [uncultured Pseudoalteromonas sp.]MBH0030264.1 recombinase family protein [Pseudoalteromonas sp. SWYJZ98]